MKRVLSGVVLVVFALAMVGYAEDKAAAPEKAAAKGTVVFVCDKCDTVALAAGKCSTCSADLKAMKVLAAKDGKATCCACPADCAKCSGVKADDPKKCDCGKDVATKSLKGKFVCTTDAKCIAISDKAGKCSACGKDLVEVK